MIKKNTRKLLNGILKLLHKDWLRLNIVLVFVTIWEQV